MTELKSEVELLIYTVNVDGLDQIVVGSNGVPFIFLGEDPELMSVTTKQIQEWANKSYMKFRLLRYVVKEVIDVIEPMPSTQTM